MIREIKDIANRNLMIKNHLIGESELTKDQLINLALDNRDQLTELIKMVFEKEKELNKLRSSGYAWRKIAESNRDENLQTAYHLHRCEKYIRDLEDYNHELKKLLEEKCSQEELKFVYEFANFDFDRSLRLPDEALHNQNNEIIIKQLRKEVYQLKQKYGKE